MNLNKYDISLLGEKYYFVAVVVVVGGGGGGGNYSYMIQIDVTFFLFKFLPQSLARNKTRSQLRKGWGVELAHLDNIIRPYNL